MGPQALCAAAQPGEGWGPSVNPRADRRSSGPVDRDAVSITGTSTEFVRVGDEGTKATFRFCPHCGATVYFKAEGMEDTVAIPVGALADPLFAPTGISVYEERMHAWVRMPGGIEHMA